MQPSPTTSPVLIELDAACRATHFDRTAAWFRNVQLVQADYRQLLEDTAEKIEEPHMKAYLLTMVDRARGHEQQAERLFGLIDREPSPIRTTLGELVGKGRELWADVIALGGGAKGPWQDLQQLYISNANSMSAFAVAEMLGLALGLPDVLDITAAVVNEKRIDEVLLQECALEMCSISILYQDRF